MSCAHDGASGGAVTVGGSSGCPPTARSALPALVTTKVYASEYSGVISPCQTAENPGADTPSGRRPAFGGPVPRSTPGSTRAIEGPAKPGWSKYVAAGIGAGAEMPGACQVTPSPAAPGGAACRRSQRR